MALNPKLTFNRITGKVVLDDLTNYPAEGINFGSGDTANGYIRIEYNVGSGFLTLYDNIGGTTPDVLPATDTLSTADIDIPLGSDGKPLGALYRLTYQVDGSRSSGDYVLNFTASYTYDITDPVSCLDVVINCGGSALTSTDTTDYDVDGATTVSASRAHTLYPPPTSGQSNLGPANLEQLTYSPISRSTWFASIVTTVTWLQADGLYVTATIEGSKKFDVVCDDSLNNIACCLKNLYDRYQSLLCGTTANITMANELNKNTIIPTNNAIVNYLVAQSAGNLNLMSKYYNDILTYSGCSADCGCGTGDISSIVQATDSGNSAATVYVVDSPDGSISVVQDNNGGIITYHIQVSAALQNAINTAAGSVAITTNTGSSLDIQNPSAGVFVIDYIGETLSGFNFYSKQFAIRKNSGAGNYYLLEAADIIRQGSIWNLLASQTQVFGAQSGNNSSTDIAVFYLQDFFVGQSIPPSYTAVANVMRTQTTAPTTTKPKLLECEVFWFDLNNADGDLRLRLYSPVTGIPYTLGDLDALIPTGERLYVEVTMTALVDTGSGA